MAFDPFAGFNKPSTNSFTPSTSSFAPSTSFSPSTSSFAPSTSSFSPSTNPSTSSFTPSTSSVSPSTNPSTPSFTPSTSSVSPSTSSVSPSANEIKAASLYYFSLAAIRSLSQYLATKEEISNIQIILTNLNGIYGEQVRNKCPPQFMIQTGGAMNAAVARGFQSSSSSSGSSHFLYYSITQILDFIRSDKLPNNLGDAIPGLQRLIDITTPDINQLLNPRVFKFKEDLYDLANATYYACKASQSCNVEQITPSITALLESAKVTPGRMYGSSNNYDAVAKDIIRIYTSVSKKPKNGGKKSRTHRKSKKQSKQLKRRKSGKSRRYKRY